ncbi:AAA family ATPase [Leptothoe kymatousa]|uniref:Chromosome segregation ATPase n=1 Tax=Leptothoe kymatousa TAU-MAC 1615 TaxID=2364775 RepID=A0ABS5Y5I7_9CYAN|nr:hypothetical protein [Leptothoe kymatousa]MBT9313110.1 hypothetical protein [Leptothoe kymatousa TAU-MAC 1615]
MTATPTDPQQFASSSSGENVALVLTKRRSVGFKLGAGWFWPTLWLLILGASSALGIWAIAFITRLPPLPDCDRIFRFSADSERLYCARQASVSGAEQDLVAGVQLVASWQDTHPLYQDSQDETNRWSKGVFKLAQQRMQAGNLGRANELLGYIPERAENHPQVLEALDAWQQEWERGNELVAAVKEDVANQNWSGARKQLRDIKRLTSDHWVKDKYQYLDQYIKSEEDARRNLIRAQSMADSGDMDQLVEALTLVRQMDMQSAAWPEAKPLLEKWATTLLNHGFQKWEQEDLTGAIAIIQQVPMDLATAPEAQDLVHLAHAQRLAKFNQQWVPTYGDIVNLMEAIQALKGIESGSPFYTEAEVKLGQWTEQLKDLQKLYGASLIANLNQKSSLQVAIAEAKEVAEGRPQRQQAQTLIAHWLKEIERIEDRPLLARAQQLADKGDKASLQAAIAEAQNVELGRALRVEAQTKVAQWTKQIQVLEDQPLYSKALELASKNKLRDAITEARKIEKGRALYGQAQDSIKEWTARIQVAQDRPILNEAEELAYQGRLSDAIVVASRIAPGRALYNEARNSIAVWDAERAYIESLRAPADDGYDDGYDDDDHHQDHD